MTVIKLKPDPLIGSQIGDYVVKQRLGGGGMGVVYAAEHPVIGKQIAVKLLRPELAEVESEVNRFISEARTVCAIGHRGIVDVFGFGKLPDGRHYLLMELLSGEPFHIFIEKRAPFPPLEAINLLEEILDALGAAHQVGVVHRDLKPSNIFYVKPPLGQPYLKLLDFGLAKRSEKPHGSVDQTGNMTLVGTPDYIAPEQARGEAVGPYTDLYSLGCIAFQMLSGKVPYRATTPLDVIYMHLQDPAPRVSSRVAGVPKTLDDLVHALMEKDVRARPASAAVVRAELGSIAKTLAVETTAESIDLATLAPPPPTSPSVSIDVDVGTMPTAIGHGSSVETVAMDTATHGDFRPDQTTDEDLRPPRHTAPPGSLRRWRTPYLAVIGGLVVAAATTVGLLRWMDTRPPTVELRAYPEPPKPPQTAPVVTLSPEASRARSKLIDRIIEMDGELRKKSGSSPRALLELGKLRQDADAAKTLDQVKFLSHNLDAWKAEFLGKR